MNGRHHDPLLALALLALSAVFAWWFRSDKHLLAAMLVFALPPLLLLVGVLLHKAAARFWAGVLALFWFSHGVMSAWSHPEVAALAWAEIVLALLIIFRVSWPGLRARFSRRR